MKKFNIIVCGRIRGIEDFQNEMSRYLKWKHDLGVVDRIVISGWKEQYTDFMEYIEELIRGGCEYVATPEPKFRSYGNIINQMKSFFFGISTFNENDYVLKTRTDGVDTNFDPIAFLNYYSSNSVAGSRSPFEKRVVAQTAFPYQPYFISDQLVFGLAADLKKLISFDIWYEAEHAFLNPEQIFHSNPHISSKPLLKSFFRANPGFQYSNFALSSSVYQLLLHNEFYAGALNESIKDIIDSYILGFLPHMHLHQENISDSELTLTEILTEKITDIWPYVQYMPVAANIMVGSIDVLRIISKMPISRNLNKTLDDFSASSAWRQRYHPSSIAEIHPDALDLIRQLEDRFPLQTHTSPYDESSPGKILNLQNNPYLFC